MKSIDKHPTKVVRVLDDNVKERICSCSLSKGVVPFAFEMLRKLKDTNIECSAGLVWEWVIVIDIGVRDRKIFIRGFMV